MQPWRVACCVLLAACCLLLVACRLRLAACCLPLAACRLLLSNSQLDHLLLAASHTLTSSFPHCFP